MEMSTPRAILDQYLELCSHDLSRMVYQLASNAVLDWNGLTVRGGPKIVKFLRQKQHAGQVQSFPGAVAAVQPFEERVTHLATKATPPENLATSPVREVRPDPVPTQPASPASTTPIASGEEFRPAEDLSFETPPKTLPALPHPPALTGGRRFRPFPSDDEADDEDGDEVGQPSTTGQSAYSELQYLETVGTVRTANEPKHRGTRTTHHIPREDPSATSSGPSDATTSSIGSVGEKRTKLKLSYRTHLRTQEVQFALIIYEHIPTRSTTVRRTLFTEDDSPQAAESPRPRSPEPVPLPDSPPSEDSPPSSVQPPGTPIKRRRIPPVIIGLRTSPRRMFAPSDESGTSSSSIQQTWPRKNSHTGDGGGGGGSASKQRKLSSASASIRKPLRF